MARENLSTQKFGRLTVLERIEDSGKFYRKHTEYKCECECGSITKVLGLHLKRGATKSCGCLSGTPKYIREQGKLLCTMCNKIKIREEFYNKDSKNPEPRRQPCIECFQIKRLMKSHNVSEEYIVDLLSKDCCQICEQKTSLVIDHNHKTGKVRDIICQRCNLLIGYIESKPKVLDKVLEYLKIHE